LTNSYQIGPIGQGSPGAVCGGPAARLGPQTRARPIRGANGPGEACGQRGPPRRPEAHADGSRPAQPHGMARTAQQGENPSQHGWATGSCAKTKWASPGGEAPEQSIDAGRRRRDSGRARRRSAGPGSTLLANTRGSDGRGGASTCRARPEYSEPS